MSLPAQSVTARDRSAEPNADCLRLTRSVDRVESVPLPTNNGFPAVAGLLIGAETDVPVHFTFPEGHRHQIRSTKPPHRIDPR